MTPRAVALQGVGYSAGATALQGFAFTFIRIREGAHVTRLTALQATPSITTREDRAAIFVLEQTPWPTHSGPP